MGILIALESGHGGLIAQTQTDSQGKFIFIQIPQAVFVIKAQHPGYREVSQRVDLTMGPTAYVILDLQPIPQALTPAPPAASGRKISVQQLVIPEGAKREFDKGHKLLVDSGAPERSLPHFRRAIEILPTYAQAYLCLGTAYMDLRMWKEAESELRKAIELDDSLAAAHLALGACLNMQGSFGAAERPLARGLELNPEAAEGHYELGRVYWALGRWQTAEPHARKALALRAEWPVAHLLMGNILMRKRDAPAALQEFKEYLRLEPDGPFAGPTRDLVAKIEQALATSR